MDWRIHDYSQCVLCAFPVIFWLSSASHCIFWHSLVGFLLAWDMNLYSVLKTEALMLEGWWFDWPSGSHVIRWRKPWCSSSRSWRCQTIPPWCFQTSSSWYLKWEHLCSTHLWGLTSWTGPCLQHSLHALPNKMLDNSILCILSMKEYFYGLLH